MKWTLTLVMVFMLKAESCHRQLQLRIPACVQDKIDAITQQPGFNPPATVHRYLYQDNYVYLITSNCCDQYNYVYDRDCNVICAPSGGITGKGDGRCTNFFQVATDETVVWKDPR